MEMEKYSQFDLENAINDVRAVSALTSYMIAGLSWGVHVYNDDALRMVSERLSDAVPVLEDALNTLLK